MSLKIKEKLKIRGTRTKNRFDLFCVCSKLEVSATKCNKVIIIFLNTPFNGNQGQKKLLAPEMQVSLRAKAKLGSFGVVGMRTTMSQPDIYSYRYIHWVS